jgi:hypothetical protein
VEARDRKLSEWFIVIRNGRLRLPRFQRGEEWTHNEVQSLLSSVVRDLPAGAALVLEVGGTEPFISLPMVGVPEPTERAVEHLLDGQQRLTALWRSLHNNYQRHSYFVRLPEASADGPGDPQVEVVARWERRGQRYPVWAESPSELRGRGLVPLQLLRPGDLGGEIREWCDSATAGEVVESRELELVIQGIRSRIEAYNIPFLSLPPGTPKEVALDVFIKTNTSYVKLTPFDIIVAQVEAATERSLKDLVTQLSSEVPDIEAYTDPSELILSVEALRQDKPSTQASFFQLDLQRLVGEWDGLISGVRWLVDVLAEERIFDGARLPTVAVLPVIAALHDHIPDAMDGRGYARGLTRKYLWRSSLTWRYGSAAATAAFQDFRALVAVLEDRGDEAEVPVFDENEHPYPTTFEDLDKLRWPKAKPIVARGVLGVTIKAGAMDIADASMATRANLPKREYHHLFPDHLLHEDGKLARYEVYRALNCALITWNTNRNIGAKDPLSYLEERTRRTQQSGQVGEEVVRTRLASHLVPYDALAVGGYAEIAEPEARQARIKDDYQRFLEARAALLLPPINKLCKGDMWPVV